MIQTRNRKQNQPVAHYDRILLFTVLAIISLGVLMVASASIVISEKIYHQPFHFFYRQLAYLGLGIVIGSVITQIKLSVWEEHGGTLLLFVMLLLALVLIPGIGHSVNGSARWLGVGPFSMQVSELAKFAVVVYLAGYLVRRNHEIQTEISGFLKPMGILAVISILLLREPDFGATTVVMATALGMMFLAGARLTPFIVLIALVVTAFAGLAISAPYRLVRLTTFLNPWANQFDSGYQLTQSLIAFGRGGWFGVGLGQSIQKLFYLPEAHTDFLFAVIAEELGLIGTITVIALFTVLVVRIFFIGRRAQALEQHFAAYLAYGFALWLGMQFIVSIGVNSGMLPTKGLTLPLMSYGGSSLLVNCVVIALLLRIDYENRLQ